MYYNCTHKFLFFKVFQIFLLLSCLKYCNRTIFIPTCSNRFLVGALKAVTNLDMSLMQQSIVKNYLATIIHDKPIPEGEGGVGRNGGG
jgi:hypothetical protein